MSSVSDKLYISFYSNNTEIAVVYFREGYSPDHYPSQKVREILLE